MFSGLPVPDPAALGDLHRDLMPVHLALLHPGTYQGFHLDDSSTEQENTSNVKS